MTRVLKKRCGCGLTLVEGKCPGGCEAYAKPHLTAKSTTARARRNEKAAQSMRGCGSRTIEKKRG